MALSAILYSFHFKFRQKRSKTGLKVPIEEYACTNTINWLDRKPVGKGGIPIETKKMSVAVIYGVGTIFAVAMIASFFFSILLRFTSLTESSLTYVIMLVLFVLIHRGIHLGWQRAETRFVPWREHRYPVSFDYLPFSIPGP